MHRLRPLPVPLILMALLCVAGILPAAAADAPVGFRWESTGDPARPLREPSFLAVD